MMPRDRRRRRVAVVGGGISGLAAAHRLHELAEQASLPLEAVVLEGEARLGGVISTVSRDGFLIEEGPDSIVTDKPWALRLAERIGLKERLVGTRSENRRSFVVRAGRLEPTPEGFYLLAPTRFMPLVTSRIFSPLGKMRMAMDLVIPRRAPVSDESVAAFVMRRLGREALERMAQPMIGGIYGADPAELSLRATFPRFLDMEREHGSVIRGMLAAGRSRSAGALNASGARYGLFVTFDGGLQTLTETLIARLPAGWARTAARVASVHPDPTGGWRVATADHQEIFDAVILALPAPQTATLVRPFDAELALRIASIVYGSAATVSLAFREDDIDHPLDGFGFVCPSIEKVSIVGTSFCHRKYNGRAPSGHALLRAFWDDRSAALSDDLIVEKTMDDLNRLLGLRGAPALVHLARWSRSMPRYAVGHLDLVDGIEQLAGVHSGLALAGNAYRGIGVPDCIRSGEAAADLVTDRLFPI
jgi:oxygen-dependent protoporphyrinogen oxidase